MQYGWWSKFRVNRPLTAAEKAAELPRHSQLGVVPSQRMGLVRINSTYIDWIDPVYADRGMANTAFLFIFFIATVLAFVVDLAVVIHTGLPIWLVPQSVIVFGLLAFYFGALQFEFFTYTHYPIRFNRKNQKIYVFRHPRKGGLLVVPWDKPFFHAAASIYGAERYKSNIRAEILDGDTVKDTFALGHDAENNQELYDRWEFIVRYMQGGPEAVADDPLDKYVQLSAASNFDNCLVWAGIKCNVQTLAQRRTRAPLIYWFAATRWLIFKTCKVPAFSPEVEAECAVDPNDPNIWPIPEHTNQFDVTVPGVAERDEDRRCQTCDPHQSNLAAG